MVQWRDTAFASLHCLVDRKLEPNLAEQCGDRLPRPAVTTKHVTARTHAIGELAVGRFGGPYRCLDDFAAGVSKHRLQIVLEFYHRLRRRFLP
jgi:hypothetical protein